MLKKLNFKNQKYLLVLNMPEELRELFDELAFTLPIEYAFKEKPIDFCMICCTKLEEINFWSQQLENYLTNEALYWFVYPKASSKKYKCEFNRDNGWQALGELGYEPVRQVAIDENWSALRFKKVENIKTITRNESWIMSDAGKMKAKKNL